MSTTAPFLANLSRECCANFLVQHPDANVYELTIASGQTTGLSAGDLIYSFRGPTTGKCIVFGVRASILQVTGFAAAKVNTLDVYVARSFTASDSGGLAATLTGDEGKQRRTDLTTTIQDMRIANTGTLTAGTRTLDTNPVSITQAGHSTGANASILAASAIISPGADFPLILGANEGFVIKVSQAYPAVGTWQFYIQTEWFEIGDW